MPRRIQIVAVGVYGAGLAVFFRILHLNVAFLAIFDHDLDDLGFHQHLRERLIQREERGLDRFGLIFENIDDHGVLFFRDFDRAGLSDQPLDGVLRLVVGSHEPQPVNDQAPLRGRRFGAGDFVHGNIRRTGLEFTGLRDDRIGFAGKQRLQAFDDGDLTGVGRGFFCRLSQFLFRALLAFRFFVRGCGRCFRRDQAADGQ